MSYVVLARKYRPRTFAQMAGQEHVVRALTNALAQQRLHHAYLFTGTRGIGKTTVSRILAKSLNCTGPDGSGGITAEPCGRCTACVEIDQDRFIDYIEMDAASNRGIDEVRDMIERAAYKPSVGRFKVFMIDEAHQLTKEAFNALLKTLEEPPEYLKFVLATTDPEKMLPTVLSRCLQFNLRPMSPQTVRSHLGQVLQAEGVEHDDGSLALLSRAARGSMRDALSLTDQAIAHGGGRIDEALVRAMLGIADAEVAPTLVRCLAARDGAAVLDAVEELRRRGASFDSVLEQMCRLLQRMAVEQALPGSLPDEELPAAEVGELAGAMAAEDTQLLYSLLLNGRAELGLLSDDSMAFTMVLLRYLAFAPASPPSAAAVRAAPLRASSTSAISVPAPLRRAAAPAPAAAARAPEEPGATAPAAVPPEAAIPSRRDGEPVTGEATALDDHWDALARRLVEDGLVSGLVRELAWQSTLAAIDPGPPPRWTLCNAHEALRTAGLRDRLAAALAQSLGQPVEIDVVAGNPQASPAQREAQHRQRRQQEAEQSIRQDPVVRELLAQFSTARIVPGSIKPL
jgi:DNA polymerase-3 subunit gamma/tau